VRTFHRSVSIVVACFALYLSLTGTLIQTIDLYTLGSGASANDPNLRAMRESINGPPNFEVISDEDYSAAPLPSGLNLEMPMLAALQAARRQLGAEPIRYIEARMSTSGPIIQVRSTDKLLAFDVATQQLQLALSRDHLDPLPVQTQSVPSTRTQIKGLHRMTAFGDWALWINIVVAMALSALLISGLIIYARLLKARSRLRRHALLWYAGDWWRTLHRSIAVVAATFLSIATLSGLILAIDSLGHSFYMAAIKADRAHAAKIRFADVSSPLLDSEVPSFLQATLAGFRTNRQNSPIKAIRIRYFSGMPQGIIIAGNDNVKQLVFNALTGQPVGMTEPGYPETGQPFGWQEHQLMKQIHRGDWLGLPGRAMDLIAGLSLIYLSVSGVVMYVSTWLRRRHRGQVSTEPR